MSETVEITCPRCKTHWQQSLEDLEKVEVVYRDANDDPKSAVVKYNVKCPVCGTYIIFEVAEE